MTAERGSRPDDTETAIDGKAIPQANEDGRASAEEPSARSGRLAATRHWGRWCLAKWRSIIATTLVVATVGLAAAVYFILYRPDQRVGDATAHRAIVAASDGAVAVLSYSYDHLNRDFDNAKSHLTGGFLTYYDKFTDNVVAPTAQQGQLTTTAKVIRAAISDLHPDSAVVLVFVEQTTASVRKKDPDKVQSAIVVTLTKVDGSWLIAKFDPVV